LYRNGFDTISELDGRKLRHNGTSCKRTIDSQTFYRAKIFFPRDDAARSLLGFDPRGEITGVVVVSMPGD
jgi:hypothetical protein